MFEAALALHARGEPIDPVTMAEELRRSGQLEALGGSQALLRIQSATPASANSAHYAQIVSELSMLRRLIGTAGDIQEMAYASEDDVDETLDHAESLIFEVAERRVADTLVPLHPALEQTLLQLERLYDRDTSIVGVPTGYHDLDELLLGLQPSTLSIVAGPSRLRARRRSRSAPRCTARSTPRKPVLFFSMEMGHLELTKRLLAAEAQIDARKLSTGRLSEHEWPKLNQAVGRLAEAPFFIDDNPHCTVMEMRAKARRTKAKYGDLGLDRRRLPPADGDARRGVPRAARWRCRSSPAGLKILARELDAPVMTLSQLNRQLEYRQDKRPMLADLRESGSIEQDADIVIFIYRDEYYNPESEQRGMAEIIVAKHRNGPTGSSRLAFLEQYTKFANLAAVARDTVVRAASSCAAGSVEHGGAAAVDDHAVLEVQAQRLGEHDGFEVAAAALEAVRVVAVRDRQHLLGDDRPFVEVGVT